MQKPTISDNFIKNVKNIIKVLVWKSENYPADNSEYLEVVKSDFFDIIYNSSFFGLIDNSINIFPYFLPILGYSTSYMTVSLLSMYIIHKTFIPIYDSLVKFSKLPVISSLNGSKIPDDDTYFQINLILAEKLDSKNVLYSDFINHEIFNHNETNLIESVFTIKNTERLIEFCEKLSYIKKSFDEYIKYVKNLVLNKNIIINTTDFDFSGISNGYIYI